MKNLRSLIVYVFVIFIAFSIYVPLLAKPKFKKSNIKTSLKKIGDKIRKKKSEIRKKMKIRAQKEIKKAQLNWAHNSIALFPFQTDFLSYLEKAKKFYKKGDYYPAFKNAKSANKYCRLYKRKSFDRYKQHVLDLVTALSNEPGDTTEKSGTMQLPSPPKRRSKNIQI